ncbi:hypothetical protein PRK78_000896 [Emydomyces testavorans]|uniref:F-box domain-containing protein n=1 Tax=Emydomyces testavorans TaxID=2070801 RepID=A0AAF0IEX2_9EURO|nr:hypothetical protein PRK78_000896 [Emydomyces testavorans]
MEDEEQKFLEHPGTEQSPLAYVNNAALLDMFSSPRSNEEASLKIIQIQSRPYNPHRPKVASNFLDTLPIELVDLILFSLDCKSLCKLSATNSIFESYITNHPCYKLVVENCQNALHSITRLGLEGTYSVKDMYDVFRKPYCSACNDLGPCLFLPKLKRCCMNCVGNCEELKIVRIELVTSQLGVPHEELINMIPFYATGPWTYFCASDVFELARQRKVSITLPSYECPWETIVQFPFLDPKRGTVEVGRRCVGCAWAVETNSDPRAHTQPSRPYGWTDTAGHIRHRVFQVYTTEGLLEHIRSGECASAVQYWNASFEIDAGILRCLSRVQFPPRVIG